MSGVTIRLLHEFDYCVFLHFFTYQSPGLRSFDDSLKFLPPFDHLFLTSLIGQAQVQPRSGHHVCFFNEGKSNHALITSFCQFRLENPKVMLPRPQQLHYNIVWPPSIPKADRWGRLRGKGKSPCTGSRWKILYEHRSKIDELIVCSLSLDRRILLPVQFGRSPYSSIKIHGHLH